MDDASIVELFQKRDETAIAELKRKYEKLCFYVAENFLSQHEDIEECINSVYYSIWNNIPPDNPDNLKIYLCRIVRNTAIKRLQYNTALKRNPKFTVSIDEIADCIPSYTENYPSTDLLADAISRFLKNHNEKQRKVFIRRYWYGDSLSAIAKYYAMNEKTVATYLFRTRKKLKTFLKKEGYRYE